MTPTRQETLAPLLPGGRGQRLLQRSQSLIKYTTALAGQASLSLFHFGLNVALMRRFEPHDYGLFALAFVAAVMGASVTSALAATPVSVYTPGLARRAPRVFLEVLLSTVNLWLVGGIFLVGLIATAWLQLPPLSALAFSGFVAAYSARQYSRSFGYARRRPVVALYGDLSYVAAALLLMLAGVASGLTFTLPLVLAGLTLANLAALSLEFGLLIDKARLLLRWRSLRRYLPIWRDTRWALIGAITTLIAAQAHSLLVSLFSGPAAYAPLAAGFVLFGPIRIALQSWQSIMRPELSVAIAWRDRARLRRMLRTSVLAMLAGVASFALLIALFWEPISGFLYASKYAGSPMGGIVAAWCGVTLCSALATTPSGALQAFRAFRILAMGTVYSAALSLVAVAALLWMLGPEYTLLGILLAEAFLAVFLTVAVLRQVRAAW